jgi:hypothetical protein
VFRKLPLGNIISPVCTVLLLVAIQHGTALRSFAGNYPPANTLSWSLAPTYDTGESVAAWEMSDLDGDGNLDLVFANGIDYTFGAISILYGRPNGTFEPLTYFLAGIGPYSVAVGDLNHDGQMDIVAAAAYQNRIAVYLALGDRQFSPAVITEPPDPPNRYGEFNDVKIGDFDGDGELDVVALQDQQGKRLRFFHVGPQGSLVLFKTLAQVETDSYEAVIALGDFNRDGISDLVLAGGGPFSDRSFSYVFGRADGNLTLQRGISLADQAVDIVVVDIDRDGDQDLVVTFEDTFTPLTHSVRVYKNNGSGVFIPGAHLSFDYPFHPWGLAVNDFNGDGIIDIAVTLSAEMVMVAFGQSDGSFQPNRYYVVPFGVALFSADLDHNGSVDLCSVSGIVNPHNVVAVLLNNGDGTFKAPVAAPWSPTFMVAGDLNGDSRKDLISGWPDPNSAGASIGVILNDVNHGFRLPERFFESQNSQDYLDMGDFNGDGKVDVVTAHNVNNRGVSICFGDGTGVIGTPIFTPFSNPILRITVGDFNGDRMDDVVALEDTGNAHVLLSNGTGGFVEAPGSPLILDRSPVDIVTGDFNSDHILDLVVPEQKGQLVFIGDGHGRFDRSPEILEPFHTNPVAGDFNHDGKLDVAGFMGTDMIALLGDGNGHFPSSFRKDINDPHPEFVVAGDFDLDGDSDIAYVADIFSDYPGNIAIVLSKRDSWDDPQYFIFGGIDIPRQIHPIVAADFNSDGKTDIAYVSEAARSIIYNTARRLASAPFDYDGDNRTDISIFRPSSGAWYLQQSTAGQFGTEFGYATDKISPADYDGDGKTDIAVYRPETGLWYVVNSSSGAVSYFNFGAAEDLPTPADYDGDGRADISVFRPSTATWYRQNSSDGSFYAIQFGASEDKPTIGDFDGDGHADVAIFRPSNGAWYQYNSSNNQVTGEQFGFGSDVITPADFDGDGKTDLAVFRPSNGFWYIRNSNGPVYTAYPFGLADDIPAAGDFDGDGKADLSVFRPSDGIWYRMNSSDGSFFAYPFGTAGDKPTQTAFRY